MQTYHNPIENKQQPISVGLSSVQTAHSGKSGHYLQDKRTASVTQKKDKYLVDNRPNAVIQKKEIQENNVQIVTKNSTNEQKPISASTDPIQKQTISIKVESNVITNVKISKSRPGTNLPGGHQGEHTTAFTTFNHMAINNVKGKTLEQARDNLVLTLESMKDFPGYEYAPKYLTTAMKNTLDAAENMDPPTRSDIENLMTWTIQIRNSIPLTANSKKTTGGHGESMHGGGMQTIEQAVRTKKITKKSDVKGDLMVNVWGLYDFNALIPDSAEKWAKLLVQHMLSMVASYPHIFEIENIYSIDDMKKYLFAHNIPKGKFGDEIKDEINKLI
ncbi:hypothetical protein [Flavobacterium sharifuzzamanii]|uniref:hypothetical protein n=1 Tax=Flavobacterium sharifuzzamanii TaxID=2211133 RepID=UPI000DAC9999|nr:hypothetical protein [Flavobacterium sharifuzzamanii]KAF2082360.1 hypothetical protein DMA14_03320 [Flavobacterium sharifuzzamanii]